PGASWRVNTTGPSPTRSDRPSAGDTVQPAEPGRFILGPGGLVSRSPRGEHAHGHRRPVAESAHCDWDAVQPVEPRERGSARPRSHCGTARPHFALAPGRVAE